MKRAAAIAALLLAAYILARGLGALTGPFILPFETAFQEMIALHHLREPAWPLLPVIARIGGEVFYHTAHPPLLHWLYAGLYAALGVHEWVTRFFSLGCWMGAAVIWMAMLGEAKRRWLVAAAALFLPAPFILATTTNYEPLSILFISLIGWLGLRERPRPWLLLFALGAGLLVDWPVYLALPALLLLKWRDRDARKLVIALIVFEGLVFAGLQAFQYFTTGEAAFFSHASTRANPATLFSAAMWRELFGHWTELNGAPAALLSAAALAGALYAALKKDAAPAPAAAAVRYWLLVPALLLLTAPGLLSRHYVHLLYLVPAAALGLWFVLNRSGRAWFAIIAVLVLFGQRDFVLRYQRQPAHYAMATELASANLETGFSSLALGTWYYYGGIETAVPVSVKASDWIKTARPGLIHLDLKNPEVKELAESIPLDQYHGHQLPREVVFLWEAGWLWPSADYLILENRPVPAISQHPGSAGTRLTLSLERLEAIQFEPAIIHPIPVGRSDGVFFMTTIQCDTTGNMAELGYARFVAEGSAAGKIDITCDIVKLNLITTPGPRGDFAFDDAYWLNLQFK